MRKINLRFLQKLPAHEKRMTLSTLLTLARFFLAPVVVVAMVMNCWGAAFLLFIIAVLTDMLDGFLARVLNQKTFLGACLDPLADKFLILSCFFTLAFISSPLFEIPLWFVVLVLCKEVIQVFGAIVLYCIKGHIEIVPTILGKATMVVQSSFIIWLFACYFFKWLPTKTYYSMLGFVLIMIFASLVQYIRIEIANLRQLL